MYAQIFRRIENELPLVVCVTVALWLTTAMLRWWLIPEVRSHFEKKKDLALYRQALEETDLYEATKMDLRHKIMQLRQRLDTLSSKLCATKDLSAILGVLIDRADSAGIRFVRIQPQPETSSADYTLYPVRMEFSTEFGQLVKFIALLESLPHIVRIDRLSTTAMPRGKLDVAILCTCFLRTSGGETL